MIKGIIGRNFNVLYEHYEGQFTQDFRTNLRWKFKQSVTKHPDSIDGNIEVWNVTDRVKSVNYKRLSLSFTDTFICLYFVIKKTLWYFLKSDSDLLKRFSHFVLGGQSPSYSTFVLLNNLRKIKSWSRNLCQRLCLVNKVN